MTSKTVAGLLADLAVIRSHSRPRVSNDDPFSEAWFKTLKYAPVFPDRFGSLQHARTFIDEFTQHYNHDHHHTGIGLHTPPTSTTASPRPPTNAATRPWPQPGPRTPNDSPPPRRRPSSTCPTPPGSTQPALKPNTTRPFNKPPHNSRWPQPP